MLLPFVSRWHYYDALREQERLRDDCAKSTARIIGLMATNQEQARRIAQLQTQLQSVFEQVPAATEEPRPSPRITMEKIRAEYRKAKGAS